MNIGEIWRYEGNSVYSIYSKPIALDTMEPTHDFTQHDLQHGDCFTVLENLAPNNKIEYRICIFLNNEKWYLEVAKSSVRHEMFKKLCQ